MFQLNQLTRPRDLTLAKVEIDPHGAHQMLTPLEECCGLNLLDHCFDFREDGWFGHQKRGHVFGIHRLGRSLGLNSIRCSGLKQAECLPPECVSSTQGIPKAELLFPCKEASRRQYKSKRICVGSVTVVSQRIVLRLEQVLRVALSLRPAACNGLQRPAWMKFPNAFRVGRRESSLTLAAQTFGWPPFSARRIGNEFLSKQLAESIETPTTVDIRWYKQRLYLSIYIYLSIPIYIYLYLSI